MDEFEHPNLGWFRPDGDAGWLGRSGPSADFYDLYVMVPASGACAHPPASALNLLQGAMAKMDAAKRWAVEEICAARSQGQDWRAVPPELWSIVEARIDPRGGLWFTLHEYETDEYSRWLFSGHHDNGRPVVRRIPALALKGDPAEAGTRIGRPSG